MKSNLERNPLAEAVLRVHETRLELLQQQLGRKGPFTASYLANLPRNGDRADYLLCQSLDLLENGHALCQGTLSQIERSKNLLKYKTP